MVGLDVTVKHMYHTLDPCFQHLRSRSRSSYSAYESYLACTSCTPSLTLHIPPQPIRELANIPVKDLHSCPKIIEPACSLDIVECATAISASGSIRLDVSLERSER